MDTVQAMEGATLVTERKGPGGVRRRTEMRTLGPHGPPMAGEGPTFSEKGVLLHGLACMLGKFY